MFGTLGMSWCAHPKWYYLLAENFFLSIVKKSTSSSMLFWRYYKDMQTDFVSFGHSWLYTSKTMIISTCIRLQCLSVSQKSASTFTSFSRYYVLKNPAIWLAENILAYNSRPRILSDLGLMLKY